MPKGDWFSYIALGLIAGIGLALVYMTSLAFMNGYLVTHNPHSSGEQYKSDLSKGQQDNGYVEPFGQITSDDIGKLKARENPDDSNYYAEQDRRAQKSMSDAAEAMLFLTEVSIILGLVGAGAIVWTLTETRNANEISRKALIAERRPWIKINGIEISEVEILEGNVKIGIKVIVKNIGNSPALNAHVHITQEDIISLRHVDISKFAREHLIINGKPFGITCFPNDSAPIALTTTFSFDGIDRKERKTHERFVEQLRAVHGDVPDWIENFKIAADFDALRPVGITGSVNYQSSGFDEIHQTTFALMIGLRTGESTKLNGFLRTPRKYSLNEIGMTQFEWGYTAS